MSHPVGPAFLAALLLIVSGERLPNLHAYGFQRLYYLRQEALSLLFRESVRIGQVHGLHLLSLPCIVALDFRERVQPVYRAQTLLIGLLLRRLGVAHKQVVQRALRELHVVVKASILGEFRLAAAVKP